MGTTSIQAGGGGDYTTIAGWESGEDGTITEATIGSIDDNNNYDEEVTIGGFTGNSATNFIELRSNVSNRHAGVAGTGHARMVTSLSVTNRILTIDESHTRIVGLELYQQSSAGSDEAVRTSLADADGVLVDSCIIHSDRNAIDQDGVYAPNINITKITVNNCVIYDWTRCGINAQNFLDSITVHNWEINYCVVHNTGSSGALDEAGITARAGGNGESNPTTNMLVKNTAVFDTLGDTTDDYNEFGDGTINWTGSNNIASDISAEAKFTSSFDSVTLTDNNSASGEVYTVANVAGDDFTSEANDGTGTDRLDGTGVVVSGITVDILGNSRDGSTPDIGPFELQDVLQAQVWM